MTDTEFDLIVQNAWAKMFGELDSAKQESLKSLTLDTQDNPTPMQLVLTRTPRGHTLLGMYYNSKIILFEQTIKNAAAQYNRTVEDIASEVMRHEVYQHHLGSNHTVRPSAPKSLDRAYEALNRIPSGGQIPYEYARPARCCPDRGW